MEIKKGHKFFDQLRMVCKSVAKEDSRYSLSAIEVNKKHIVATDGRRMACLDNFGIDPGRYTIGKLTQSLITIFPVEIDGNFPKYQDILDISTKEITREDQKQNLSDDISIAIYKIAKAGACIRIEFLKDFMNCDQYCVLGSDRQVTFYTNNFVGVIMPINADD